MRKLTYTSTAKKRSAATLMPRSQLKPLLWSNASCTGRYSATYSTSKQQMASHLRCTRSGVQVLHTWHGGESATFLPHDAP